MVIRGPHSHGPGHPATFISTLFSNPLCFNSVRNEPRTASQPQAKQPVPPQTLIIVWFCWRWLSKWLRRESRSFEDKIFVGIILSPPQFRILHRSPCESYPI